MQPIDGKQIETPENKFYGVDVNNRMAVEQEFQRLRKRHRTVTILVILALIVLGFFVFDYIRVTEMGGKPYIALKEKVEDGTKYKGIGYEVLYCSNGERYVGPAVFKKCTQENETTINNLVYKKFVDYLTKEKMLDKKKLDKLEFNLVEVDEKNELGGSDYHVNLKYSCKKGKKCLILTKEYYSNDNVDLYIRFDNYNEVDSILYFKDSGVHYNNLVSLYTEKLKEYLLANEKIDEENLRQFELSLVENHGKYKFRSVTYAESYLVKITYLCNDNSNTCVHALDDNDLDGDFTNLMFYGSMFLDSENNVLLFGPKEYFDL